MVVERFDGINRVIDSVSSRSKAVYYVYPHENTTFYLFFVVVDKVHDFLAVLSWRLF
jgi:hypothetical protein